MSGTSSVESSSPPPVRLSPSLHPSDHLGLLWPFVRSRTPSAPGAGFYFFGTDQTPAEAGRVVDTKLKQAGAIAEAQTGLKRGQADYDRVYQKIADVLDADDYDDGSYGPVLVRLAVRPPSALSFRSRGPDRSDQLTRQRGGA